MARLTKVTPEEKIQAVKNYLSGETTLRDLGTRCGVHHSSIEKWITIYQTFGESGLYSPDENQKYPITLKREAVQVYLGGNQTLHRICRQYKIRSLSQLQCWIEKYQNGGLN